MPSASALRNQIEASLANRIPSALTPPQRTIRPVAATGIPSVDDLLDGGLPLAAITEIAGPSCSGRTSLAMSFIARLTQLEKVCAWIDVSDEFDPESAAAAGVDLPRLLWVRCGVQPPNVKPRAQTPSAPRYRSRSLPPAKPWARIEQALRVTDLLLQGGGFSAIVLDMASIAPEYASRVELGTWFRYRAAAEQTQASILLLTQHSCARSSAELLLRLHPGDARRDEATVFTGIKHRLEVTRRRFEPSPTNVVPFRKPPQRAATADWQTQTTWAGVR
jgi:hypothetical protein